MTAAVEPDARPAPAEKPARSLWRNMVESYATRIVLVAMGLLTTVVVSRALGPEGRGFYAVAVAVGAIGVQFGNFGLHASNTYSVAKEPGLLPVLIANTLLVSFGAGGLFAIAAWGGFTLWPSLAPVSGLLLPLTLSYVPIGLGYLLLQNLLLGTHQVRAFNAIEIANKALVLLFTGVLIWVGRNSAESFFAVTVVALILASALVLWQFRPVLASGLRLSLAVFRENLGVGIKAYAASFFSFLVLRLDLVMVKHLVGAEEAGYYSLSETMAENILTLPIVVGTILFPRLSAMRDRHEKMKLTTKAGLLTAGLLAPLLLAASLLAAPVVRLVFGARFLPAVGPFLWLMPGCLFLGVQTVIVQYLNSLGYPPIVIWSWAGVTALNIGINFWLIPAYGITGAAISSTICYTLIFVLVLAVVIRYSRRSASPELA